MPQETLVTLTLSQLKSTTLKPLSNVSSARELQSFLDLEGDETRKEG